MRKQKRFCLNISVLLLNKKQSDSDIWYGVIPICSRSYPVLLFETGSKIPHFGETTPVSDFRYLPVCAGKVLGCNLKAVMVYILHRCGVQNTLEASDAFTFADRSSTCDISQCDWFKKMVLNITQHFFNPLFVMKHFAGKRCTYLLLMSVKLLDYSGKCISYRKFITSPL